MHQCRRLILLLAFAPLAACGFQPLYGGDRGQAVTNSLTQVELPAANTREEQIYRNALLELMQPRGGKTARYRLESQIAVSETGFAIESDATASRYNVTVVVNYRLLPVAQSATIQGSADSDDTTGDDKAGADNTVRGDEKAETAVKPLTKGSVRRIGSYDAVRSQYATLVAREDAISRVLQEAARDVHRRLSLFLQRQQS